MRIGQSIATALLKFYLVQLTWVGVANTSLAQSAVSEPEPGTREYFEQKIRGKCAYEDGELLPVRASVRPATPGVPSPFPTVPLVSGRRPLRSVFPIEGHVVQALNSNLVAVGQAVTNISGLVTYPPTCLVTLLGDAAPAEGASLRLLAVLGGTNPYREGAAATLRLYRQVPEPTYEDYRRVFERDSHIEDDPIVSFEREDVSQRLKLMRLAHEKAVEASKEQTAHP